MNGIVTVKIIDNIHMIIFCNFISVRKIGTIVQSPRSIHHGWPTKAFNTDNTDTNRIKSSRFGEQLYA